MISGVSRRAVFKLTLVFDAADGTLPRLHQSSLKLTNITRIFITHLHADHVLGLVAIMTTIMSGIGTTPDDLERLKAKGTNKRVGALVITADKSRISTSTVQRGSES